MEHKVALLSGIRGQDGSYLAELLLSEGYRVIGFERHTQNPNYNNIKNILDHPNFILEKGDVTDFGSLCSLLKEYKPDYFYNLAANSFVASSWHEPTAVLNINAGGVLNCLEAIRIVHPTCRFYQASTSEVVGNSKDKIQNEDTILTPHSPYAAAKSFSEHICYIYKKSYGIFASFGRLYNHESKRRNVEFVTKKVTDWIGKSFNIVEKNLNKIVPKGEMGFISVETAFQECLEIGKIKKLQLGNRWSSRDWGSAEDYVKAMKLIIEYKEPDSFVIATGKMHSIDDLLNIAFGYVGIDNWQPFVEFSDKNKRPDDVVTLCGDYSKAKKLLGWEPKVTFKELISDMVKNDIELNR